MQNIIDFHCHIYPVKIAEKARQSTGAFYGVPCGDCRGTAEDLLARCDRGGITHCLVHSVATKPEQVNSINQFLAETVGANPQRIRAFGTIHQDTPDVENVVDTIIAYGMKGIKIHPDIQGVPINDPRLMKVYAACEGRLMVLLHTGDDRYHYSNPEELIPVLEAFPKLTVIGAHFGGYRVWSRAIPKLAQKYENFYIDCSSSRFAMEKETFLQYLFAYGEDRVLFGSDYPMWEPDKELAFVRSLDLPESMLQKLLWNNAAKLLQI